MGFAYTAGMKVLNDWKTFPRELHGGVLCIGNFDGVHVGHARMLERGRDEARRRGTSFAIFTFEPHPSVVLKPGLVRHPLTTARQRESLLASFSPDVLLMVEPTPEFLSMTASAFLRDVVHGDGSHGLGAKVLVEGPTFTFGRGAKGTVATLQQEGAALGFQTIVVPTQEQSLTDLTVVKVSSSVIRWLIGQGRVADAQRALGRPYTMEGRVVEGAKRGREIGFPTANIQTEQLVPAAGVYAGRARVEGSEYVAAISIGDNPTFGSSAGTTVEAYLLDFEGNVYGKTMEVEFHKWVREMISFSGVGPLVAQMKEDVKWTRQVISAANG
jgi:riboflavin kinase / FMN adenylyltransferase